MMPVAEGEITDGSAPVSGIMLSVGDIVVVCIYFLMVMSAGLYSMFRPNRNTVAGFFLAGRFMWWLPVGASLFASNIGSEHFIGLAGSGAASGIAVGAFEINALILLQLLGWVFLPVFIASKVNTLPEYMKKRFGGRRIQAYLAVLSLILYIFTKISVNMYSGALFIQQAFKWNNLYIAIGVLLLMTALCTVVGGLAAVIYTDTLQFFIMISGSIFVLIRAFKEVGSYSALQTKYLQAIPSNLVANSSCGLPRTDSWQMLRNPYDSDLPWPAFLLGQTPASIWYWCADQMMVQRVMAARSLSHAQGATLFAGYAKLLPLFVIVLPGMISRVLFPDEVGCVNPEDCIRFCGSPYSCSNFAYPKLVLEYMPGGMRGVMLSVMLSALMSDLTSIFNSASMLFTMDIWSWYRPKANSREQLQIGRLFIVFMVVVSILWVPIIEKTQGGQLYIYIQAIAAYLAPPIAAVYCMAIMWPRMNEEGAFWGLLAGFCMGIGRMMLDFSYKEPLCYEEDTRPLIIAKVHYMYFAVLLFWFTCAVATFVGLMTKPPEKWRLARTTFFTRYDKSERNDDLEMKEKLTELLSQITEEGTVEENKIRCCTRIYKFLFVQDDSLKAKEQIVAMNKHIEQLSGLHQEKWQKYLLNFMLIVIVITAVSVYIYFSINPFTPEEVRHLQEQKLLELSYNSTEIMLLFHNYS